MENDFSIHEWKFLFRTNYELDLKEYGFLSLVAECIELDEYDSLSKSEPMTCLQQDINFQVSSGRGSIKHVRQSLEEKGWIKSESQSRGKSHIIQPTLPEKAKKKLNSYREWEKEAESFK